jgi:hypothetical protein
MPRCAETIRREPCSRALAINPRFQPILDDVAKHEFAALRDSTDQQMVRGIGSMRRASQVMRVIFKFSWAFAVAVVTGMMMPCSVQAHPMGNFSINHYAKLVPGTETIELDYIIDMAEIPIQMKDTQRVRFHRAGSAA